ncbi:hypothetical protein R4575_16775 [Acinetobacter baumannii]|nr:hypothetical protein [Acinetobacter baumannii]
MVDKEICNGIQELAISKLDKLMNELESKKDILNNKSNIVDEYQISMLKECLFKAGYFAKFAEELGLISEQKFWEYEDRLIELGEIMFPEWSAER